MLTKQEIEEIREARTELYMKIIKFLVKNKGKYFTEKEIAENFGVGIGEVQEIMRRMRLFDEHISWEVVGEDTYYGWVG